MLEEDDDYDSECDQDYVPSEPEDVSDEENSGEEEDLQGPQDTEECKGKSKKQKSKKANDLSVRKRHGGIKLDGEEEKEVLNEEASAQKQLQAEIELEVSVKKNEKEKKRSDDLWSSFLSDVGTTPKRTSVSSPSGLGSLTTPKRTPVSSPSGLGSLSSLSKPVTPVVPKTTPVPATQKVTVTKKYDFAGETICITKEVEASSKEAKEEEQQKLDVAPGPGGAVPVGVRPGPLSATPPVVGVKRPGGGLGGVLDKLNKKPKISTLDKSKLDWDSFKEKEGIEEDLQLHNRGKGSYLERMAFLQRTDHRQFEIERNLRQSSSGKR